MARTDATDKARRSSSARNKAEPPPEPDAGAGESADEEADPPAAMGLVDVAELAVVFEEWARRYEADPEAYEAELGEPETYGEGAARYFAELYGELILGAPADLEVASG